MAKCNICGTRTWFFQTHRCKAKPKQEIGRQTVAARSHSERRLTSIDTTDLYLVQQQQNLILQQYLVEMEGKQNLQKYRILKKL